MTNKPLRIVCFGDSITGSRPREPYRHLFLKYADLLQLMLEARLGAGKAQVLNRGHAGQTSRQALARVHTDIVAEHPDIVTILIGGNDRGRNDGGGSQLPQAETRSNLRAIFTAAQDAGIRVLALQYHFLPGENSTTAWHWLDDSNPVVAETAAALAVPVLDMAPLFRQAVANTSREELVNADDGVHLNPGGEMVYARAIFSRLDELNWI